MSMNLALIGGELRKANDRAAEAAGGGGSEPHVDPENIDGSGSPFGI